MPAIIIVLTLLVIPFSFLFSPSVAQATNNGSKHKNNNDYINTSFFKNCPNPEGTLVVSYPEGWHWIVGEENLKWGSDSVYDIGNGNYVQCYCPKNQHKNNSLNSSQGIQTNWLKESNITPEQKDFLILRDWIYIQNGAEFGLLAESYLAKNSHFFCNEFTCLNKISQKKDLETIKDNIKTYVNKEKNDIKQHSGDN